MRTAKDHVRASKNGGCILPAIKGNLHLNCNHNFFFLDNDLDGETLATALGQGPLSLKRAIPTLSKRLKLIGTIN